MLHNVPHSYSLLDAEHWDSPVAGHESVFSIGQPWIYKMPLADSRTGFDFVYLVEVQCRNIMH